MASTTQKAACNRKPFVSEDGCDRGSVDIHQFDDFPFCDSVSPTPPKVPPEVIDTPIVLPIPSPCACFNINHNFEFKYNKQRKFEAKATFAAKGDCCEGEYDAGFNLQIPCPIVGDGERKITAKINWKDARTPAPQTFVKTNKDACTIEPNDVTLDLGLPCPVKTNGERKITAKIDWKDARTPEPQPFVKTNNEACTIEPEDVTLDLGLPCPVKTNGERKITAKMAWKDDNTPPEPKVYVKTNNEACTIEPNDVTLDLGLPCPVKKSGDTKIKANVKWGNQTNPVEETIIKTDNTACTIEPVDANLNLEIKCPIIGGAGNKKIKASIKYGNGGASASATYLKTNTEACTIEGLEPNLNLQIPCPVSGDNAKLTIGVAYGTGATTKSVTLIEQDTATCSIKGKDAKLSLNLPCPVSGTNGAKKIKASIKYGNGDASASATYLTTNPDTCTVAGVDLVTLNLQIPSPISKTALKFETSFVQGTGSTGDFTIYKDEFDDDYFTRTVGFKVTFPKVNGGGGGSGIAARVVAEIQYKDHKLQVKYINLKTGVIDTTWTDVFTAVKHTGSC